MGLFALPLACLVPSGAHGAVLTGSLRGDGWVDEALDADLLPTRLRAELMATTYGERRCDAQCAIGLARRLRRARHRRPRGDAGGGGAVELCAAALEGRPSWPLQAWLPLLRSHLPVWELLVRAGFAREEVDASEFDLFWSQLQKLHVQTWAENLLMRRADSPVEKAEMLLMAAATLSLGRLNALHGHWFEASFEELMKAEDLLIAMAWAWLGGATSATNITGAKTMILAGSTPTTLTSELTAKPDAFQQPSAFALPHPFTPKMLGLLHVLERGRVSSFQNIARFAPREAVVVFAGAHAGSVLRTAVAAWPHGQVHAFEADPFLFAALESNYKVSWNLHLTWGALATVGNTSIVLHTRSGQGSQSTVFEPTKVYQETWRDQYDHLMQGAQVRVPTIALSDYFQQLGVPVVDFIYLDIECSELSTLRGARSLLPNVSVLHLEVQNVPLCKGGPLWDDMRLFLRSWGFYPVFVPKPPRGPIMDIIAVRMSRAEWER
eukprot:TRINITY_DN18731_c0_g1_i1.p1 TRINITY_DN18731_c0_g1~~TRINITY_DN18731_c0_g1_i1.p1  ORF type:complete len:494 (+),score=70.53 TRINITY_DN18731_c0_g1_i1:163-1644(+)